MDMSQPQLKQRQGLEPTQRRVRHIQCIQARNLTFVQNSNQRTLASALHYPTLLYPQNSIYQLQNSNQSQPYLHHNHQHTRSLTPSIELPSGASSPTRSYFRSPWKSYQQGIQKVKGPGSDTGSVSASESGRGASSVIREPIARLSAGLKALSSGNYGESGYTSETGSASGQGSYSALGRPFSSSQPKSRYRSSLEITASSPGYMDPQRQQQHQEGLDRAASTRFSDMTSSIPHTPPPPLPSKDRGLLPNNNAMLFISKETNDSSGTAIETRTGMDNQLPPFVLKAKESAEPILLDTYFTFHTPSNDQVIYTSDTVIGSNNPKYNPLEDHRFVEPIARRSNSVVVRIWAGYSGSDFSLLLEWRVELCCLRYIGKDLRDIPAGLPNNTILFKLENGFYTAPDEDDMIEHPHTSTMELLTPMSGTGVRRSYTYESVMRLNNLHECIEDTKKSRDEIKHNIELTLTKDNTPMIMNKRRGEYVERLSHLRRQMGLEEKELGIVQKKAAAMRQEQARRRKALEDSRERGQTQEMYLEENMINLANNKESLFLALKEYTTKRTELIATLFTIFPITESEKDPNLLKICNVPLPNSVYIGMDEEAIAVALGFACHLVTMLAHYLAVPLRYPLTPMGSRAFVVDPISILVGPREFPLFGKGQDKSRFEYGVFLFNKNIDQLLNSQGLQFMDLRQTLPNLRYLMEALLTTSPTQSMLYRSKYLSRKKQDRLGQDQLNDLFVISLQQREFDHILHPVVDANTDDDDNGIGSTVAGKRNRRRLSSAAQPVNNEHSLLAREYDPIDGEYTLILDNASMRSPRSQKEASENDISTHERCGPRSTPTPPKGAHESVRSSLRHDYSSSLNLSSSDDDRHSISESQYQTWTRVEPMNEIKQGNTDVDTNEPRTPFDPKISTMNSNRSRSNAIEDVVTGSCGSRLNPAEGGYFTNSIIVRGDHSTSRPTHDDLPANLTNLSIHSTVNRQVNSYTETDMGDTIVPPGNLQSPPPSISISISSAILSKESSQTNAVERSFQEPRRIKSDYQQPQQPMEDDHPYVGVRSVKSLDSAQGNQHLRGHRVSNKVGVDTGDGELTNSKQMIRTHQHQSPSATTSGILEASS